MLSALKGGPRAAGAINFGESKMRRRVFIPAALAAAALLLGACKAGDTAGNAGAGAVASQAGQKPGASAPSGTTEVHADGVRRVTPAELKAMLENGSAALYDTRPKEAYDIEHITGARSMPSGEVAGRAGELPKDKTLVFYCT
jgi:hypothetical protein